MKKNRYWPDWKYELPDKLLAALDEYHILKVPLLGQHYERGPEDWCGRTSCAMAFNYYQLVQGSEFESNFITHWDGGQQGRFVDLRYPGGQRAFHTKPSVPPHNVNLSGYSVSDPSYSKGDVAVVVAPSKFDADAGFSASHILGFSFSSVLPYDTPNRKELAARIANAPSLIESKLATILEALASNNPVIFYSGFSMRGSAPIHLILITGYAYLRDDTGRHLWLAVADPATHESKIKNGMYFVPAPGAKNDLDALSQLSGKHDMIRVITGSWDEAKASLVLLRARKLFEENTLSSVRDDLYMDYWGPYKGGAFLYSHRLTPAPPECVFTNVAYSVAYPMDSRKERFRPVNCFAMTEAAAKGLFPLGSHRNLHSGVHLELASFSRPPPPPPPPKEKKEQPAAKKAVPSEASKSVPPSTHREVRCLAPGYIVAVRMANALPVPTQETETAAGSAPGKANELIELAKKGLETNQLCKAFAGNHNSFILVRHDVEESLPKEEQQKRTPKRFTFYSLYMHLVPPDWKKAETYRDVAWLKVLARRDGCLSVLDPEHPAFQQVRWLQAPAEGGTEEESDIVPKKGGTFSTIGSELSKPETFQLGDENGGYIRAVFKKADRDLTELHEALIGGEIVTLCHPFLKVRAGELLGYLDEKSEAVGDGFLHWEVLAPSGQGQLEQFLQFAEEKLGLSSDGKSFFKFFEEKEQNNFFDPPAAQSGSNKEGELESLLKLAPVLEQASEVEKSLLTRFHDTYNQGLLQELLESSRTLPFYAPKPEDKPADEPVLSYPVDVLLENYKDCLPKGTYQLKFTFEPSSCPPQEVEYDGKKTRVRLYVPANARKIFVQPETPGSLFLQSGGNPSRAESLKKDVEHFRTLASARWRNVVLRHLNEWSPKNIVKQVQEHLKAHKRLRLGTDVVDAANPEEAKKIIQEYAEAIGWWEHKEKPVLGPKGDEKPLFADNPDDEQLPKETLLDNPHPVTFAWLLMLLTRHNFIQFADKPLWHSEEMKKIAALGWLPAWTQQKPRRVGEFLHVGAVQRGNGKDPVTLHVKLPLEEGDWRRELARGTFTEGVFAQPVEVPGWGKWSLDEPGAQVLGGLTLEGLEPVLLKTPEGTGAHPIAPDAALVSHNDGTFSWRLAFRSSCPALLRGWILIRKWKGKVTDKLPEEASAFEAAEVAIPVVAREDTALKEEAGFAVVDGFIKKGNIKNVSTYVTQNFTYKEFLDAAKGQKLAAGSEPLLSWDLVEAVQRIRSGYAARQPVSLSALSADGLSIQLRALNLEKLREAVASAKENGWIDEAEEAGKGEIRIRVKAPGESQHPGELVLEFDANEAFSELRKELTHEEQLAVRFGCIFPNGGSTQDGRLLPSDTLGKRYEAVKVEDLKSQARGGYLEQWSTGIAEVLHSPMFGEPEVLLTKTGALVCVPLLGGDVRFWTAAAPSITFGSEELDKKAKSDILSNPLRVVRGFEFSDKKLKGKQLVISAAVKKKDVPLKSERIDVRPSKRIQYDMEPGANLEARPALYDPFVLSVSLATSGVPAGRRFKVELVKPEGSSPLLLPKDCITYELRTKEGYGMTDSKGVFRAKVDVSDISEALQGGKEYELRVVPVDKADNDLAREKRLPLPEPLQEEAVEVMSEPFLGMWPEGLHVPMKGERVLP